MRRVGGPRDSCRAHAGEILLSLRTVWNGSVSLQRIDRDVRAYATLRHGERSSVRPFSHGGKPIHVAINVAWWRLKVKDGTISRMRRADGAGSHGGAHVAGDAASLPAPASRSTTVSSAE